MALPMETKELPKLSVPTPGFMDCDKPRPGWIGLWIQGKIIIKDGFTICELESFIDDLGEQSRAQYMKMLKKLVGVDDREIWQDQVKCVHQGEIYWVHPQYLRGFLALGGDLAN